MNKQPFQIVGILLLLACLLASCGSEKPSIDGRVEDAKITATVIADWIIEGRNNFLLVDLRSKEEYEKGSLPGAIHVDADQVGKKNTLYAFPTYKKLVFFGQDNAFATDVLLPAFYIGLNVLILNNGYQGWIDDVMTLPSKENIKGNAKRVAVSKYFRGESVMGTPGQLTRIPAQKFIRSPQLPKRKKRVAQEGC